LNVPTKCKLVDVYKKQYSSFLQVDKDLISSIIKGLNQVDYDVTKDTLGGFVDEYVCNEFSSDPVSTTVTKSL